MAERKTARKSHPTARRSTGGGRANADGKALVIVESPAKAKTINRYLGGDYVVRASMGHVRDLPQRDFGVDLTSNFEPTYTILPGRSKVVNELRKLAGQAEEVFLATDLDREGEAIAWHLSQALDLPAVRVRRVIFNQITRDAIRESFSHPHQIDMDKVNAQQARRILDRIVGYQVSPLLWRTIRRGLSAGRVQTVAVRLIVEREREIRGFQPEEYWRVGVEFNPDGPDAARRAGDALRQLLASADPRKGPSKQELFDLYERERLFRAEVIEFAGQKLKLRSHGHPAPGGQANPYLTAPTDRVRTDAAYGVLAAIEALKLRESAGGDQPGQGPLPSDIGREAASIADTLAKARFRVEKITSNRRRANPPGPFTTAAMQQAAVNQLGMSASTAMRHAQRLYEGAELPGEGSVGLITYMRTDSMNLAPEAINAARAFIGERFGGRYVPDSPQSYASAKGAQEAHEAIRPTDVTRTPDSLRDVLEGPMWRLYDLIWRRFVACQMAPADWQIVTVDVRGDWSNDAAKPSPQTTALLRASGRKLLFDGFLAVAGRRDAPEPVLPEAVAEGVEVWPARVDPTQHFTEPPARYSEASLVKALEEKGIGRPSTYAAIIDTIQQRRYVELKEKRFYPTHLGEVVTDKLIADFPHIFDVEFTRFMESELDRIEEAHADWVAVLREFYEPFSERLAQAGQTRARSVEPSPHRCPTCGRQLLYRISRTGQRFLGCEGYPECDYTADVNEQGEPVERKKIDVPCPVCGKPMALRTSRMGPFLGCTGYPECSGTLPCDEQGNPLKVVEPDEIEANCPECNSPMAVKFFRGRSFLGCSNYPQCKATAPIPAGLAVRKPKAEVIETSIACDKCSRPMVVRSGRKGKFLACSGFPKCRNARNLTAEQREALEAGAPMPDNPPPAAEPTTKAAPQTRGKAAKAKEPAQPAAAAAEPGFEELDAAISEGCPDCKSALTLRSSRFGPFLGCSNYPKCRKVVKLKGDALKQAKLRMGLPEKPAAKPKATPTNVTCTQCGKPMVIRSGRSGQFLGCSGYPKCRHTAPLPGDMTTSQ